MATSTGCGPRRASRWCSTSRCRRAGGGALLARGARRLARGGARHAGHGARQHAHPAHPARSWCSARSTSCAAASRPRGRQRAAGETYTRPMRVHPAFSVGAVKPGAGQVTPDELALEAHRLQHAVHDDQLQGACAPRAEAPELPRGWVQRDATTYEMQVNLDAQTKYTLSIDAKLTSSSSGSARRTRSRSRLPTHRRR